MTDLNLNADAVTNLCEHCKQPVVPGQQVVAYIQPNEEKNGNTIQMLVHIECAPKFFGRNIVQ